MLCLLPGACASLALSTTWFGELLWAAAPQDSGEWHTVSNVFANMCMLCMCYIPFSIRKYIPSSRNLVLVALCAAPDCHVL
jgi:hypothetical protein